MAGTSGEPVPGVVDGDTAPQLESAWPGGEGVAGGQVVAAAEFDHVAAGEPVVAVAGGKGGGRFVTNEIFTRARTVVTEGAADDLFNFAIVQIDAGPELGHVTWVAAADRVAIFNQRRRGECGGGKPMVKIMRLFSVLTLYSVLGIIAAINSIRSTNLCASISSTK